VYGVDGTVLEERPLPEIEEGGGKLEFIAEIGDGVVLNVGR